MASSKQVLLLAAVACLASMASATVWMVGDGDGWRAKFNQTNWADGKTFVVGDSLMFMYPKENHTVAQMSQDDFATCNLLGHELGSWDSGNDVVPLDKPGKVWFICTKPYHCVNGMKLAIDVVAAPFPFPGTAPAPAPSPFSSWAFPWWGSSAAPAPAPALAPASPPSAAVRNSVGAAVAAAAAAVVAAALAF